MSEKPRIGISDQFRESAVNLATNLGAIANLMAERDECAIRVASFRGALLSAEQELEVRERAVDNWREISEAASKFFLTTMEQEAQANIATLREAS